MANNNLDDIDNLEDLDENQLRKLVRRLQFKLRGEEHLTKQNILDRLRQFEELGLEEDDLMDVEQEYNMGLRKSGWMKIYNFVQKQVGEDS